MDFTILDNLIQNLATFLNKYYYIGLVAGLLIGGIVVFLAIKLRFKVLQKNNPEKTSKFMSFLTLINPEILNKMVSDEANDREKILNEIKKFSRVKEFKKINTTTVEILVEVDGTDRWYRAKITSGSHEPKILSLTKIS